MTKEDIHGNMHGYTQILKFYDLITQNSETHSINFWVCLAIPWDQVFKGLESLVINIG